MLSPTNSNKINTFNRVENMKLKAFTLSVLLLLGLSIVSLAPALANDWPPEEIPDPWGPFFGVWILSPSNGSTFAHGQVVDVEALAIAEEDRGQNISYYAWFLDGVENYSESGYFGGFFLTNHEFEGLSVGEHNITFIANSTWYGMLNDSITIVVQESTNPIPEVEIISPEDGSEFDETENIIVTATAYDITDYIDGYRWKLDGNVVDEELGRNMGNYVTKSYVFSGLDVGIHAITFMAFDNHSAAGSDTIVIKVNEYIAPNILPIANFIYYNTTESFFYFNDTSVDPDGEIIAWAWDFENDGTIDSTDQDTSHNFTSDGSYTVKLTVTDNGGATNSTKKTITVGNILPIANAGVDQTAYVGDLVNFIGKGTDEDGEIVKYEWDFDGDGTYDWTSTTSGNASYMYNGVGFYYAKLRVTDNDDATDTDVARITVTYVGNEKPVANAGQDQRVNVHEVVVFIGIGEDADGDIILYEWDFDGDGVYDWSSESSGVASYIYHTADRYTAVFRVTDNLGDSDNDTAIIRVEGPNVESERVRFSYDFRFYGLRVERIYKYDNETALTMYTLRITNLLDERRLLLIRETIPENITESISDVEISVVPDWVYSREKPIEIGWNVTLERFDFFEVNFTFYKYIDSERFEEMEKPRITEFEDGEEIPLEEEFQPAGVSITGFVFGVFANPWVGLIAVIVIASLTISFWRKDEVLIAWEGFKFKVEDLIRRIKEI